VANLGYTVYIGALDAGHGQADAELGARFPEPSARGSAVQQQSAATTSANSGRVRLPQVSELRERPRSTLLPLVCIQNVNR
jgi:hypothetical protein